MQVSELFGIFDKENGKTVYIIGTGPSLRVFPKDFLTGETCIGLNRAYEHVECFYNLTIHPELIPRDYVTWYPRTWITKKKNWLTKPKKEQLVLTYWFDNNKDVKDFRYVTKGHDCLYVGRGIHTTALVLAARMGAKTAVLVGVDMLDLAGDHHATSQSVRFHGFPPREVYNEYYANTCILRKMLRQYYKMEILCLSSLLGNRPQEDYKRLLDEYQIPLHPPPKDDSPYKRKLLDFS
jgi:hypothetical protein